MTEFICLMQDKANPGIGGRWYFSCEAEDEEHAREQAFDGYDAKVIAVYRRVS